MLLRIYILFCYWEGFPIAAPARSKAWVCGLYFFVGIMGSNSAEARGSLSPLSVVFCWVEVCASGRSLAQRSPADCGVSEYDREGWTQRRP